MVIVTYKIFLDAFKKGRERVPTPLFTHSIVNPNIFSESSNVTQYMRNVTPKMRQFLNGAFGFSIGEGFLTQVLIQRKIERV